MAGVLGRHRDLYLWNGVWLEIRGATESASPLAAVAEHVYAQGGCVLVRVMRTAGCNMAALLGQPSLYSHVAKLTATALRRY